MTGIIGYFDDSQNENIIVVGGYVGATAHWDDSFTPAWKAFVNDPEWPSKITEFKAADCRGGYNEFRSWPDETRHRCFRRAVEILRDSIPRGDVFGIAIAIALPPEWTIEKRDLMRRSAYLIGFGLLVTTTVRICGYEGIDARKELQLIFDNQKGLKGHAQEMFESAVRLVGLNPDEFEIPQFGHSDRIEPLQAADLVAYETFKETKKRRVAPNDPVSGALMALLDAHYHYAACVPEETFDLLLHRHLARLPTDPEELRGITLYESGKPMRGNGQ